MFYNLKIDKKNLIIFIFFKYELVKNYNYKKSLN